MAIKKYESQEDFERIKNNLIESLPKEKEYFDDVVSVLVIEIKKTVTSGNRSIQQNVNNLKDFFPIIDRSKYISTWRYRFQAKVDGVEGTIILRPMPQTKIEYNQITFEGSAQEFKRTLETGDKIIFVKKKNSEVFELFKIKSTSTTFTLDNNFFAVDVSKIVSDKTYFSSPVLVNETQESKSELSNIILYGAPGTGKTRKLNIDYLSGKSDDSKAFITFHQAYSYEEFIEGIKPSISKSGTGTADEIAYEYSNGSFFQACEAAAILAGYSSLKESIEDTEGNRKEKYQEAIKENKIYSFCIDEINRANVAGVFGDLITLIEVNKRIGANEEMIVSLPYSKRKFGVPANLQIIGTMNTADRSITLLDTALRRRFEFIELAPNSEVFKELEIETIGNIDLVKLFDLMNERIKHFLGKDQCIGHAYFLKLKDHPSPKKELLNIFVKKIIPLLEEYFYNDYERIRLVLGDDNPLKKNSELQFFVLDKSQNPFLTDNDLIDEEKNSYSINKKFIAGLEEDEIDERIFTLMYNNTDEAISS